MPGDDHGPSSLCAAQEAQWEFMSALAPDDPGDARVVVVDNRYLDGALDPVAMRRAFADVTRRHDGLRLTFDAVAPDPLVRVLPDVEPPVEFLDLARLGERRQRERLAELVFRSNRLRVDLRAGPLWRAWVVRLGAERFFLNASFSHVVADGWACKVFLRDLVAAYAARTGEAAPPVAAAPSFADLRALQARRLAPRPERVRYWRERLLPLAGHAPPVRPADPGADLLTRHAVDFHFRPETLQALKRVAWRARTTPFVVLLAGYHLLLSATTGRDRTVVSTATFGRPTDQERRAVFQCVSDPYVSTTIPEDCTLGGAVVATHEALTTGAENLVSYKALARAVNPAFDSCRPWADFNLCDGNFYSGAFEDPAVTLAGVRVRPVTIDLTEPAGYAPEFALDHVPAATASAWAANCGPSVEIGERRERGRVIYSRALHTTERMLELATQYLWFVDALARGRPGTSVGELRERFARRPSERQNDRSDAS
jgi:hypothetical protein